MEINNKTIIDNSIILKLVARVAFLVLFFMAQGANNLVFAFGTFDPTSSTITLPSSLTIPANTAVGTIVYTSEAITTSLTDGSSSTSSFSSKFFSSPTLSSYGNSVYDTGIPGLGFRLRGMFQTPSQSGIKQYYDDTDYSSYSWSGSSESYDQYTYLELVVTGNPIASGPLDLSDIIARLRFNYSSAATEETWTIYLSGTTNITGTSCEVNTYDTSVDLGSASTQSFTAAGSTSQSTDFTINLICSSLLLTPSITFSGTVDGDNSNIFANDSGTATGVGVQLLYGDTAITPDTAVSLGTATSTSATDYDFKARLYQTTSAVTAGSVDTTVNFTLEYE